VPNDRKTEAQLIGSGGYATDHGFWQILQTNGVEFAICDHQSACQPKSVAAETTFEVAKKNLLICYGYQSQV